MAPPVDPSTLPSAKYGHPPSETGYDPASPWKTAFNAFTNRMTPLGHDLLREDLYHINAEQNIATAEAHRDFCFAYSPMVVFMQKQIQLLNGTMDASNVHCVKCPARLSPEGRVLGRQGGGFSPEHGIVICANEMRDRKHLEDTLAHEMVHAWDHLRWKVDWADLRHAACSEIRASSLSGECRWTREFFLRNNWNVTQQHQNCVRRRAIQSLMMRPNCKDDVHATKIVNEVWDSCFNDTRPFDGIYR